jgi:hypothetical protein
VRVESLKGCHHGHVELGGFEGIYSEKIEEVGPRRRPIPINLDVAGGGDGRATGLVFPLWIGTRLVLGGRRIGGLLAITFLAGHAVNFYFSQTDLRDRN